MQAVDRLGASTTFAGEPVLDGSASVAAGPDSLSLPRLDANSLGSVEVDGQIRSLGDVSSGGALAGDPAAAQSAISSAISDVATARGQIGAFQSHAI